MRGPASSAATTSSEALWHSRAHAEGNSKHIKARELDKHARSLVSLLVAALGVVLKVLCSPQISKPRDLKRKSNFCKYAQDALAA